MHLVVRNGNGEPYLVALKEAELCQKNKSFYSVPRQSKLHFREWSMQKPKRNDLLWGDMNR